MRKGYWIILDELNLAPTDVLEALNRLLDDNRELLITETYTLQNWALVLSTVDKMSVAQRKHQP